jgi:hypothetical protein
VRVSVTVTVATSVFEEIPTPSNVLEFVVAMLPPVIVAVDVP